MIPGQDLMIVAMAILLVVKRFSLSSLEGDKQKNINHCEAKKNTNINISFTGLDADSEPQAPG